MLNVSFFFLVCVRAVYSSSLPDNEECFKPHDDVSGRQIVSSTSLFVVEADYLALEELYPI